MDNPWFYVEVPKEHTLEVRNKIPRGLVPVTVTLGNSTWDTSLLPLGNGKQFIPLKAKIRKNENINVRDEIELSFTLRKWTQI